MVSNDFLDDSVRMQSFKVTLVNRGDASPEVRGLSACCLEAPKYPHNVYCKEDILCILITFKGWVCILHMLIS